jgi:hypothetical protein
MVIGYLVINMALLLSLLLNIESVIQVEIQEKVLCLRREKATANLTLDGDKILAPAPRQQVTRSVEIVPKHI